MSRYNLVILTESRYLAPKKQTTYTRNILMEESLLAKAVEKHGLSVCRKDWADPDFNWSLADMIIFRTTWDYANNFSKFSAWFESVRTKTRIINSFDLIQWNIDKHYLADLEDKGVHIPPTEFIDRGDDRSLSQILSRQTWKECVLKPAVGGGARNTYRIKIDRLKDFEDLYRSLINEEDMLLQEFQQQVITKGEVTFMLIGGMFTHAVLKKVKDGDFRVQDDFGGTVHHYDASKNEIEFAERVLRAAPEIPPYARVDAIWDNNDQLAVSELELFEPELWFRFNPDAADKLADVLYRIYQTL